MCAHGAPPTQSRDGLCWSRRLACGLLGNVAMSLELVGLLLPGFAPTAAIVISRVRSSRWSGVLTMLLTVALAFGFLINALEHDYGPPRGSEAAGVAAFACLCEGGLLWAIVLVLRLIRRRNEPTGMGPTVF